MVLSFPPIRTRLLAALTVAALTTAGCGGSTPIPSWDSRADPGASQLVGGGGRPSSRRIERTACSTGLLAALSRCS